MHMLGASQWRRSCDESEKVENEAWFPCLLSYEWKSKLKRFAN